MDGSFCFFEGVLLNWIIFFGVEDVDEMLWVICDNGGSVVWVVENILYG